MLSNLALEIYALRREGRLVEARQKAERSLWQGNQDQDVWQAYAWTLSDICKQEQQKGNLIGARQILDYLSSIHFDTQYDGVAETLVKKIQELKLVVNPFYEQIKNAKELSKNGNNDQAWNILTQLSTAGNLPIEAHDDYGWVMYRYLTEHFTQLDSVKVRTLLLEYINLENERPSLLHSQILNFAIKYSKQDCKFKLLSFFQLWKPNNLRHEDFKDSCGGDGKTIPSLMSRMAGVVVDYPLNAIQEFVELFSVRKGDVIEMLEKHFFWKLYRCIKDENSVSSSTWDLFNLYLEFSLDCQTSLYHSKILGLAERTMKENNAWRFYDFFKKWDPKKLRMEDWQEEHGTDGNTYKPLAIISLKRIKEALENYPAEFKEDLQWLIDLYGIAIEKFPADDLIIRSKAQLHLRAGQLIEAQCIYKDLSQKIGDKYYIWSEFAECSKETDVKIALLCKALSLEKNEDFIGKIRLELARQLINLKKYENAVVELCRYKKHYIEKGWRIAPEIDNLFNQCTSVIPAKDKNAGLYAENILIAENYAYADIPFTEVVLVDEWENKEGKTMIVFVDGEKIEFAINKKRFPILKDCHKGQVWKFRLYKEETVQITSIEYSYMIFPITETIDKIIPLTVTSSETADWSSLPAKYGYIQHVNTEKKVYHIYSTDSTLVYEHYERQEFEEGDYVKLRQYKKKVREVNKVFFCDIHKCTKVEALEHFKCQIVAVDDVNNQRQLFHFVLGPEQFSGIMHYSQTDLRPSVGDCIKIHYIIRETNDKKNPSKQKYFVEVLKAEATDEINNDLIRHISGLLEVKYRGVHDSEFPDFAFIDDYYVHKNILEKYNITSDCEVFAKAIYTGNKKWKIYDLEKQ